MTGCNKEMLLHQAKALHKINHEAKSNDLAKLSSKLDNLDKAPKTCWSIISQFLSNKMIPIKPRISSEGKLIFYFKKKAELFNSQFASQCSSVENASTLQNLLRRWVIELFWYKWKLHSYDNKQYISYNDQIIQ